MPEVVDCSANGTILGTGLTWKELESDMQRRLETTAVFGEGRHAETIGKGNGLMSFVCIATLDWSPMDKDLPSKVVVKITGYSRMKDLCDNLLELDYELIKRNAERFHNNELCFYELVENNFEKKEDFGLVKYYCGRELEEEEGKEKSGYLVLEAMENSVVVPVYESMNVNSVVNILEKIARVGAQSLKNPKLLSNFRTGPHDFFLDFFNLENLPNKLADVLKICPSVEKYLPRIQEKMDLFLNEERYRKAFDDCSHNMLTHGDVHNMNILFSEDGNNPLAIIDWQVVHIGSPAEDILRICSLALSQKDKNKNRDFLIESYYKTLCKECKDMDVPFTIQELTNSYEKLYPLLFVPVFPMFASFLDMVTTELEDESQSMAISTTSDKIEGIAIDCVNYLEKWY